MESFCGTTDANDSQCMLGLSSVMSTKTGCNLVCSKRDLGFKAITRKRKHEKVNESATHVLIQVQATLELLHYLDWCR